jgi:hypothetical protein
MTVGTGRALSGNLTIAETTDASADSRTLSRLIDIGAFGLPLHLSSRSLGTLIYSAGSLIAAARRPHPVVDAAMRAQNNAGSTTQPTGTFTINAAGKFTVP